MKLRSMRNPGYFDGQFYGPSLEPIPVPDGLAAQIDAAAKARNEPVQDHGDAPDGYIPLSGQGIYGAPKTDATIADAHADHIETQKKLINSQAQEITDLRAAMARLQAQAQSKPAAAPVKTTPPPANVPPAAPQTPAQSAAPAAPTNTAPAPQSAPEPAPASDGPTVAADQGTPDAEPNGPKIRGASA